VPRCIGDEKTPHAFPTFCPKALGMKGRKLLDTTLSRCIDIELKRKRASESVEHFRSVDDAGLEELRQQALRWSIDNAESLKGAEPEMPTGFDNRLGDNYRLLLAIADLAGGEWPERARQAAQRISGTADATSAATRLLAAIRAAFDQTVGGDISSADLVAKLTAEPDSESILLS
jgi:putative DNA primase/helicase